VRVNLNDSKKYPPMKMSEILRDAIRYWETRRIAYNLILTGVVLAWIVFSWPHFRPAFTFQSWLLLGALAVLANVCYCGAYVADLTIQYSPLRPVWIDCRWTLWLAGMLLALVLANYWIADEIYPFVH
jgi:hypothetical protein